MNLDDRESGRTVRQARDRYFAANGLGDGGYDARWVTLHAGPLPIHLPNTQARIRAVRLHDLHHPLTGYGTTWTGEAEIGAWEIASSCASHVAAWVLNLAAIAIGVAIAPVRTFRAFVRGRHSRNLYRETFGDALLAERIDDVRRRLSLDRPVPRGTWRDALAFGAWSAAGIAVVVASLVPLAVLLGGASLLARAIFG